MAPRQGGGRTGPATVEQAVSKSDCRRSQQPSAAESENSPGTSGWLLALDALLVRLQQLHKREFDATIRRLRKEFTERGCVAYAAWLTPGGAAAWLPPGAECPPTNPSPELETVALSAVMSALNRIPAYAPAYTLPDQFPGLTLDQLRELNEGALTPDQRHDLEGLRLRVIRLARDRLNDLDGNKSGAGGPVVPPEWEGDDWDALDPKARQLLLHMRGRKDADLRVLCPQVWGKEYLTDGGVTEAARETATSKANKFLRKRESSRFLRKVRGEPRVHWQ
jgi:hypothetical protein